MWLWSWRSSHIWVNSKEFPQFGENLVIDEVSSLKAIIQNPALYEEGIQSALKRLQKYDPQLETRILPKEKAVQFAQKLLQDYEAQGIDTKTVPAASSVSVARAQFVKRCESKSVS